MGEVFREQGEGQPSVTVSESTGSGDRCGCRVARRVSIADIHDGATGQVGQWNISPRFVGWPRLRQHAALPITTR